MLVDGDAEPLPVVHKRHLVPTLLPEPLVLEHVQTKHTGDDLARFAGLPLAARHDKVGSFTSELGCARPCRVAASRRQFPHPRLLARIHKRLGMTYQQDRPHTKLLRIVEYDTAATPILLLHLHNVMSLLHGIQPSMPQRKDPVAG